MMETMCPPSSIFSAGKVEEDRRWKLRMESYQGKRSKSDSAAEYPLLLWVPEIRANISEPLLTTPPPASSAISPSAFQKLITSQLIYAAVLAVSGSGIEEASSEISERSTQGILRRSPPHATAKSGDRKRIIDEIVTKKEKQCLREFGGVEGVARELGSDLKNGLTIAGPGDHVRLLNPSRPWLLFHSFGEACKNVIIVLFFVAASLSLGFGLREDGWHGCGWLNGAILFGTIFIMIVYRTIKSCREKLSDRGLQNSWGSEGRNKLQVQVVRQELLQNVSETDLKVGDVAVLRKGGYVPANGLFIDTSTSQMLEMDEGLSRPTRVDAENPFLHYGSKVINGNDARMLVTSTHNEMMCAENECFESRLHKVSTRVHVTELFLYILTIIVLFLRFTIWGKLDDERRFRPDSKGEPTRMTIITDAVKEILTGLRPTLRILIVLLSLSLIGIAEVMITVISVAVIIQSRKASGHKAMVRDSRACLSMASITTICTDTFGGLTEAATEDKFYVGDAFVSESSLVPDNVLEALFDGIGTLSSLVVKRDFIRTLSLIASCAEERLGMKTGSGVEHCKIIRSHKGLDPLQECCQVVIKKSQDDRIIHCLHCIGTLQAILPWCSRQYDIRGRTLEMDEQMKSRLVEVNGCMQDVIAFAYTRMDSSDEPPAEPRDLTFVGMIGLKKTEEEDTKQAISTLSNGGVQIILLSGCDNVEELRNIGEKCGILTPNDPDDQAVITAAQFTGWSNEQKMDNVKKIRAMGNCSSGDKTEFIKCLKEKGEVVALLGQRKIDVPTLKQADIGIAVGTWSSTVAREYCNIFIWEGNCFRSLANLIECSRRSQENIRKLLQLQLIFMASSLLINTAATLFFGDAPMTPVELILLNLAVPLSGGLALLTGPSTNGLTSMLTVNSSKKLITNAMWRNIGVQVLYLTSISLALQYRGEAVLTKSGASLKSLIWNGFFLSQLVNIAIATEPEKKNILSGLYHQHMWFFVGLILLFTCQVAYALAEHVIWSSSGLNLKQWGACLLIALGSWLLDLAGKIVHDLIPLLLRLKIGCRFQCPPEGVQLLEYSAAAQTGEVLV